MSNLLTAWASLDERTDVMRIGIAFKSEDERIRTVWQEDATEDDFRALLSALAGDPQTVVNVPNVRVRPHGPTSTRSFRVGRIIGLARES